MPAMFVKQRVADYHAWQSAFDRMAEARSTYGLVVRGVYRDVEDRGSLLIALDCLDLEQARAFVRSPLLAHGRAAALAVGRTCAEVWFSDEQVEVE